MARDSDERPMTDADIEELREEIREALADELGGAPEYYRSEEYLADRDGGRRAAVTDGGDS